MKNLKKFSNKLSALLVSGLLVSSALPATQAYAFQLEGETSIWAKSDLDYIEDFTYHAYLSAYEFSSPALKYDLKGLLNQFTWKYINQPEIVDDGNLAQTYAEDWKDFIERVSTEFQVEPVPAWAYSPLNLIKWGVFDTIEENGKRYIKDEDPINRQSISKSLGVLAEVLDKEIGTVTLTKGTDIEIADKDLIDASSLPYIQTLIANKIINLDAENKFNPNKELTVEEMLVIVSRFKSKFDEALVIKGLPKSGLKCETYSIANPNPEETENWQPSNSDYVAGVDY